MASDVAMIEKILAKDFLNKDDLVRLLRANSAESRIVFERAAAVKKASVGDKAYFRGLIEYSNRCAKNCFYCGIRAGNDKVERYEMTEAETLAAARFALESRYASIVLQGGERTDEAYIARIERLIRRIQQETGGALHITLSLGEQSEDTFRRWLLAGAHRYLLRIETSNPDIYSKLHPADALHTYARRRAALDTLRRLGYQVGTGVMIGLPFQSVEDLADDLIFFRDFDIDMTGMGPYIEHRDTPLYRYREAIPTLRERFLLALKMVALLRVMMKNINIAATTAMQAIDPLGREKALKVGANVLMPNLTPTKYRADYLLYENKPCIDEEATQCRDCLEARVIAAGSTVAYDEWGDSRHFMERVAHADKR